MYAELHYKTNFSFLEGASHPDELVCRAAELGYRALGDHRSQQPGRHRAAHGAAKDEGLKLIVGAEITPDDAPSVVLWAIDRDSYGRLSRLITLGRRRAPKGECQLRFDDIAEHSAGLLAGVRGEGREERGEGNEEVTLSGPLPSPLSSPTAICSAIAVRCWPNCITGRTTEDGSSGSWKSRGKRASRWRRPATCIITCPNGRNCTTC